MQDQASEKVRERVERALGALESSDLPERVGEILAAADEVAELYRKTYEDLHFRRGAAYQEALDETHIWPEWEEASPDDRKRAVRALVQRACASLDYDADRGFCRRCRARIATMRSDLAAVQAYLDEAHRILREAIGDRDEGKPLVRLRLRDLAPMNVLRTAEDVDALLAALREALLAHLQQGEEVEIE